MTKMLKRKVVELPIFPVNVNFVSGDYNEFIQYLAECYNHSIEALQGEAETHCVCGQHYIWFNEDTVTIPVMYHELGHVTFNIMTDIGMELTDQEAFCYIQEYLFEQISKYVHNLHWRSV